MYALDVNEIATAIRITTNRFVVQTWCMRTHLYRYQNRVNRFKWRCSACLVAKPISMLTKSFWSSPIYYIWRRRNQFFFLSVLSLNIHLFHFKYPPNSIDRQPLMKFSSIHFSFPNLTEIIDDTFTYRIPTHGSCIL